MGKTTTSFTSDCSYLLSTIHLDPEQIQIDKGLGFDYKIFHES